jgi:nicotinate-nucleotide--dimethylbenzimidazole phosphoribosyltransferase
MPDHRPLIGHTANPELEEALRAKLQRRRDAAGGFGELEPLALRLGLMQGHEEPRFRTPQLMLFASDHGIAVDGIASPSGPTTARQVQSLLTGQWPLAAFARAQGLALTVVDAGVAERLPALEGLLTRKIAHGTRNARVGPAMSLEQALAAVRAGIEIADTTTGNAVGCAGLGIGSAESAALVLSRLTDLPVRELLRSDAHMPTHRLAHLMVIAQGAHSRHRGAHDPVEVLAALGGFDIAMMAGVMLGAARRRSLLLVDGLAACAALCIAQRVDAGVIDYALFARSHGHQGLDLALGLFQASSLLELGLESIDGTGTVLAWPLVNSAALLLSGVKDPVPVSEPAPSPQAAGDAVVAPMDPASTSAVG